MGTQLEEVTDLAFANDVVSAPIPVVVDFWAARCGPCHALTPVIEELAARYAGKVAFKKLDVDAHLDVPQQYGIRAIPTLLFFKGGNVVGQLVGNAPGMRAKVDVEVQKLL